MAGRRLSLTWQDRRMLIATVLALAAVAFGLGSYFNYTNAHEASLRANEALVRGRESRRHADYALCRALRKVVGINNRDRATIQRGLNSSRRAIPLTRQFLLRSTRGDPAARKLGALILGLLISGEKQNERNLRDRPRIAPPRCSQIANQPGSLPAPPTTTAAKP